MRKSQVHHGVGTAVCYDASTGREVLRITKQTQAAYTFAMEETKVYGGSGLDMIDSFETGRTITLEFTDAVFDLRQLEIATGKQTVSSLSQDIMCFQEGVNVPVAPYQATLLFASTCREETVRVRFGDTWEDMAPQPAILTTSNCVEAVTGVDIFTKADAVVVNITAVLTSGIESVKSPDFTVTIAAAKADIVVTLPDFALSSPAGMPLFDVNELAGFNVYYKNGVGAQMLSNGATPVVPGTVYTIVTGAPPAAGLPYATPTVTGQYTVTAGVITFAPADVDKGVMIDYVWVTSGAVAECDLVDLKSTCLRNYVTIIWTNQFKTRTGLMQGFQMEIFLAKYTGDYAISNSRADAATFPLKFDILNPERADNTIVKTKIFPLPANVNC
jgi:hypothetical protein